MGNTLSEDGRLYARAWQGRFPAPHARASIEIAATYRRNLDAAAINALPLKAYDGPVHLVKNRDELTLALTELQKESVIGFDTETRPIFQKGQMRPVALVQLAGENAVWLVQLKHIPFGEELAGLLSKASCIKAGVAIRDDMHALTRIYPFSACAVADLGQMAKELGLTTLGLRGLGANLLGFRISKSMQCSNWEKDILDEKQIAYAATDAWLGREIYLRLISLGASPPSGTPYRKIFLPPQSTLQGG